MFSGPPDRTVTLSNWTSSFGSCWNQVTDMTSVNPVKLNVLKPEGVADVERLGDVDPSSFVPTKVTSGV